MATFVDYTNILPDPINIIGTAGQSDPAGSPGGGFASVKLRSQDSFLTSVTDSGRRNSKAASYHRWMIDITYHPMTREEFDPVYTFLIHRKTLFQPFYVMLPQYSDQTHTGVTLLGNADKGLDVLTVNSSTETSPHQLFTINSESKIYMIDHVETETLTHRYSDALGAGEERLHITPGLEKYTPHTAVLDFIDPLIYVQQVGNSLEYSIDSKNLYSFSLKLEEVVTNA